MLDVRPYVWSLLQRSVAQVAKLSFLRRARSDKRHAIAHQQTNS